MQPSCPVGRNGGLVSRVGVHRGVRPCSNARHDAQPAGRLQRAVQLRAANLPTPTSTRMVVNVRTWPRNIRKPMPRVMRKVRLRAMVSIISPDFPSLGLCTQRPARLNQGVACLAAQKTAFVCEGDQLEPVAEFQFFEHAAQVGLDGGFRDEQAFRHFSVAEAFGGEQEDVPLPH